MPIPPAPLFRDPIYDGAADPTIIWNRQEETWWILYTCRRANVDCQGVAWGHGTDIGVASSDDGGQSWRYRGILEGLKFERGRNTFWAPEILWHEDRYHMYVSYVRGVPHDWSGERHIIHYTSADLWCWQFESMLPLSSNRVIDACVHPLPDCRWRMWYKDEVNQSHSYTANSDDLYHWTVGDAAITDCSHEGPNVFQWQGYYWLVTDHWQGLGVYRSDDCERWTRQANILEEPGEREDDEDIGRHADILVRGENAYIFYFTHPGRKQAAREIISQVIPYSHRRSSLQVAMLTFENGQIRCDRNAPFDLQLKRVSHS